MGLIGGLLGSFGELLGGSWPHLEDLRRLLGVVLEAHEAIPRRSGALSEAPWQPVGSMLSSNIGFYGNHRFTLIFRCFLLIFQVLGGVLEGSMGSWRPLSVVLRPLGGLMTALGGS